MTTIGVQLSVYEGSASVFKLFLFNEGIAVDESGYTLTEVSNGYFTTEVSNTLTNSISYEALVTKDTIKVYSGWLLPGRSLTVDDPGNGLSNGTGDKELKVTIKNDSAQLLSGVFVDILNEDGVSLGIGQYTVLGIATFNVVPETYKIRVSSVTGYDTYPTTEQVVGSSNVALIFTLTTSSDTATGYTDYGPRRVKTKEMEIEQFTPLELIKARERETATPPSWCDGHNCVGRGINECR